MHMTHTRPFKYDVETYINKKMMSFHCENDFPTLVNYLVSKILGTEMLVDLENLGTR